ncbi:LamG domain-containing protein [Myceligenerans halotolerans]
MTVAALSGVVLVPAVSAPAFADELPVTDPVEEGPEAEDGPTGDGLADDGRPVLEAPGDGSQPVEDIETVSQAESEALAEAADTGEPVEVVAQRSEQGEVWAQPDGTLEGRSFVVPQWTRVDGDWARVDTALREADGVVAPVASTVDVEFSAGGDGPLVRMDRMGRVVQLTWPEPLPSPGLDGDTATYSEVLDGVDLQMTATEDGYASYFVVKTPEAAASPELAEIRFALETQGLDVSETEDGGLEARDQGAAGVVFAAPPAAMWDTVAEPDQAGGQSAEETAVRSSASGAGDADTAADAAGETGDPDTFAEVGVEVSAERDRLTLIPDQELLTDPETTFPVVIDPQWHTPKAGAWASPNESYPDNMGWKFNGKSTQGLGTCTGWSDCPGGSTYRLMYQFDVSRFKGTRILSAEFVVKNTHSAVCSNHRVDLWRVGAINSSNTSWNKTSNSTFWKELIAHDSFHYGGNQSTCNSAADAEFGIRDTMQWFADEGWGRLTLGMRAYSETDKSYWKKFSRDGYVRVKYNRPPNRVKATQLSMNPGGTCADFADAPQIRSIDKLVVSQATDPDVDRLRVRFTIMDLNNDQVWTSGLVPSSSKANGSAFSVQVPKAEIPQNQTLRWAVRVWDGHDWSAWSYEGSGWKCHFRYDTSAPQAPEITSGRWSASDPEDPEDPWLDGVGQSGKFNFSSSSGDVVKYRYEINAQPTGSSPEVSAAQAGFWLMPSEPGVYTVNAQALDAAGNKSDTGVYQVRIGAGRLPVSTWGFDGAQTDSPLTLSGDAHVATLPAGERVDGDALVLDSTGDSGTAPSSERVATTSSFAVEAWVYLDAKTPGQAVFVSQAGPDYMDYKLYYTGSEDGRTDRWAFGRYTPNQAIRAASSDVPVRSGRWTHLVGVHNSLSNTLLIYVDGVSSSSMKFYEPVDESGPVTIGAGRYSATADPTSYWPGKIDSVRLYNRYVPGVEAKKLADRRPAVASRWSFEELDTNGEVPNQYVDDAGVPGPVMAPQAGAGLSDFGWGKVGLRALDLDGTQHAYTPWGQMPIDTSSSLTVAAFVSSVGVLSEPATVMSLTGLNESALRVRAVPGTDETGAPVTVWELVVRDTDGTGGTVSRLTGDWTGADSTDWTHVAVTYDSVARTARLWINGASPDMAQLEQVELLTPARRVTLGAGRAGDAWGEHWPGVIDDAWVFQGVLSSTQIELLATGDDLPTAVPGA